MNITCLWMVESRVGRQFRFQASTSTAFVPPVEDTVIVPVFLVIVREIMSDAAILLIMEIAKCVNMVHRMNVLKNVVRRCEQEGMVTHVDG